MAGLHPVLRTISRNLPRVARAGGFDARVTSGYRSTAKQAKLYQRWISGLHPYPVAPPGTSDHEKGYALDVVSTNTDKLVSLLTSVGLFWGGPSDPVHFSLLAHTSEASAKSAIPKKSFWESFKSSSEFILDAELTLLSLPAKWLKALF